MNRMRNSIAFWLLGFCNNYGIFVMLCAAHDIIHHFDAATSSTTCGKVSTGILIFPVVVPSMISKLVAPFLPFYIKIRMLFVSVFSVLSFLLIAFADTEIKAVGAVALMSLSLGIGESSLFAYSARFDKNVVSMFASGTGLAGVLGALSYAGLVALGSKPKLTFLLMLFVPFVQLLSFFVILVEPRSEITNNADETRPLISQPNHPTISFAQKLKCIPNLMKYVVPLSIEFLCEYLINQGLVDLIYFPGIWLDKDAQFRWLQFTYQVGVFVSRSSSNLFTVNATLVMPLLNIINVILFAFQAKYFVVSQIWIVFGFSLWVGLLGGCCFVNTFNRITNELTQEYKSFSMSIASLSKSFGIIVAAFLSILVHSVICKQ